MFYEAYVGVEGQILGFLASALEDGQNGVR
jgi:hypothetical protein